MILPGTSDVFAESKADAFTESPGRERISHGCPAWPIFLSSFSAKREYSPYPISTINAPNLAFDGYPVVAQFTSSVVGTYPEAPLITWGAYTLKANAKVSVPAMITVKNVDLIEIDDDHHTIVDGVLGWTQSDADIQNGVLWVLIGRWTPAGGGHLVLGWPSGNNSLQVIVWTTLYPINDAWSWGPSDGFRVNFDGTLGAFTNAFFLTQGLHGGIWTITLNLDTSFLGYLFVSGYARDQEAFIDYNGTTGPSDITFPGPNYGSSGATLVEGDNVFTMDTSSVCFWRMMFYAVPHVPALIRSIKAEMI